MNDLAIHQKGSTNDTISNCPPVRTFLHLDDIVFKARSDHRCGSLQEDSGGVGIIHLSINRITERINLDYRTE